MPWWQPTSQQDALSQWLQAFVRDELLRKGLLSDLDETGMTVQQVLDSPRDAGLSSLDMLSMASRLASCLGLDRTGLADLLLARRSWQGWLDLLRRSLGIDDSELGFHSSGSTGSPALSRHQLSALELEAETFADILQQHAPGHLHRVVSTVPCHHIYGFIWGMLLPQVLQIPAEHINVRRQVPNSWAAGLQQGDVLVTTPDFWTLLLELSIDLPEGLIGISSTAPLPEPVARALRQRFPSLTLIEVYGSTETAGLAWRHRDAAPYTLLPYWQIEQGSPLDHAIHQQQHIRIPLNDAITLIDERYITLHGRRDDTVQINGHNIHLPRLADLLCTHSDIAEARVRAQPGNPQQELHFFLALHRRPDDEEDWCHAFSEWMARELGNVPPPSSIILSDRLPRSSLGKPQAWQSADYPAITGLFRSAL